MRSGRSRALAAGVGLLALAATPARADDRWPVWPTELTRIADRIHDVGGTPESERMAAFERLHLYATPIVRDIAIRAVADPSAQIRKEALDLCALRSLRECIPAALRAWNSGSDLHERIKALKVIALDPSEARALVLFGALRDPDENTRVIAVRLIATAPFPADGVEEARRHLLAKLTDAAANVRGEAAIGLARLGGADASLAVVRLLGDPDPGVREQAAVALGRFADPRTRAALTRAVERGGTPTFVREAVGALASLPGDDVDEQLLALFDEPPEASLSRRFVADAIGRRREPSDALVDGLIERLRVTELRDDALSALRRLGDAAVPGLERARARGLEPSAATNVEDLLVARALPTQARPQGPALPAPTDREGWHALLRRADDSVAEQPLEPGRTDREAVALAAQAPPWLGGAVASAIERAGEPRDARPWLIALATTPAILLDARGDAWVWMRLAAWATDEASPPEDRCLALSALGAATPTRHRQLVARQLVSLPQARASTVRACAAMSLGRLQDEDALAFMLRDPVAQVRAGAAIGAANLRRPSASLRRTIAAQAVADVSERARTSAAWARDRWGRGPAPAVLFRATTPARWDTSAGWLDLHAGSGGRLSIPVVGPNGTVPAPDSDADQGAGRRWMLVPGLVDFVVEEPRAYEDPGIVSGVR